MKKIEIQGTSAEIGNIYYVNYKKLDKDKQYLMSIQEVLSDRTKTQNAYYWSLLQQYAEWSGESINKLHNENLSRYGVKTNFMALIPEKIDVENMSDMHFEKTSEAYTDKEGKTYIKCRILRGSHEYNTKQMNTLILGLISRIQQDGAEIDTRGYKNY